MKVLTRFRRFFLSCAVALIILIFFGNNLEAGSENAGLALYVLLCLASVPAYIVLNLISVIIMRRKRAMQGFPTGGFIRNFFTCLGRDLTSPIVILKKFVNVVVLGRQDVEVQDGKLYVHLETAKGGTAVLFIWTAALIVFHILMLRGLM